MYLFTRAGRFAPGSRRGAVGSMGTITEKVHQETGLEVSAWMAGMSPEMGTCVWSTFVESLTDLEAAEDELAVSEPYLDLVARGAALSDGPLSDRLGSIVHGTVDPSAPRPSHLPVGREPRPPTARSRARSAAVSRSPRRPPASPACPPCSSWTRPVATAAAAGSPGSTTSVHCRPRKRR